MAVDNETANILRDIVNLRNQFYSDFSELVDSIIERAPKPEPIKDAYIRIDSFSRSGIKHVVAVKDGNVRCSCEAATYRPENGECCHVRSLKAMDKIDPRAVFIGGM